MHGISIPIYFICKSLGAQYIGFGIVILFGLLGFLCGTFKIPNSEAFKFTRLVGGESIDDIVLRYIKFKKNKNKIYITKEEEE